MYFKMGFAFVCFVVIFICIIPNAGGTISITVPRQTELQHILRKVVQKLEHVPVPVHGRGTGCDCDYKLYTCGCCAELDIPKIELNETGCVNLTYLAKDYGISLVFTLNGRVIINETVSARNPPPLCFGVPYLTEYASICIDFYNMDISASAFSGCVKIQARLSHIVVEEVELGCFKIPLTGLRYPKLHQEAMLDMAMAMTQRRVLKFP